MVEILPYLNDYLLVTPGDDTLPGGPAVKTVRARRFAHGDRKINKAVELKSEKVLCIHVLTT